MRRHILIILAITLMGVTALAADPVFLDPSSMKVDPGDKVTATGMDWFDHDLNGTQNFNPNSFLIHLADVVYHAQDMVVYSGVEHFPKNCAEVGETYWQTAAGAAEFFIDKLMPKLGAKPNPAALETFKNMKKQAVLICEGSPKDKQQQIFLSNPFSNLVLADVRDAIGAEGFEVSGEKLAPYSAGFPLSLGGRVGVVMKLGPDAGTDAVIIGAPKPFFSGDPASPPPWNTPLLSGSLTMLRFTPNTANNKVLQFNSFSSGWLDRPLLDSNGNPTNSACFVKSNDPNNPFGVEPKSDAQLLKAGCVGEGDVVAMAMPHLYINSNAELDSNSRDLVVVNRSAMGDYYGYLTVYKRTPVIPTDKGSFFLQDLLWFVNAVTNTKNGVGIPNPRSIAVLKGTPTDSVVVTSGTPIVNPNTKELEYFIYRYDGKSDIEAIRVGCNLASSTLNCPLARRSFSPHNIYVADINGDTCEDILLVRARTFYNDQTKKEDLQFASYFDLFLQGTTGGKCNGSFSDMVNPNSIKQSIVQWDPLVAPEISSLALANFDRDPEGRIDVMAGDFSLYLDPSTKKRTNYIIGLMNVGGILNSLLNQTHTIVNTKEHGEDIGVIQVKADAYANVATVIGAKVAYPPIKKPPPSITIPNPCAQGIGGNPVPKFCGNVCPRDNDGDGKLDLIFQIKNVDVLTCENGVMVVKPMEISLQKFTYTPDCKTPEITNTKTGRQWIHEWAHCDNCSFSAFGQEFGDVCDKGPENGGTAKCYNPSQTDSNNDGYGDICSPNPDPGKAQDANLTIGSCQNGTDYRASWRNINGVDNDTDKDGVPDCMVTLDVVDGITPTALDCTKDCDSCNPSSTVVKQKVECTTPNPSGGNACFNPSQAIENFCTITVGSITPLHEDKVMYADEQPVIAYQKDLKLTGGGGVPAADNGHEVTVLLNKTNVTGTPPACQGTAEECFCEKNPNLPYCMCKKDPSLPECRTLLLQEMTCCLDVCRGDLTAPFPAMCDYIRPYNDEIRKITGLCMDVLVPVEGTQYHLSCTLPNAPALNLGAGKAYAQVFKASGGQVPRNYFKNWQKPVANWNLLDNNVLLNPLDDAITGGAQFNVGALPKPSFSYDASLSAVAPEATINQAPGITQIDGIMQIETYLADIDPATGAPVMKQVVNPIGGSAPAVSKALLLDIKGFSSPPGCQWSGSDCPDPMRNPPSPQYFVNAVQAKVLEYEAAGKPITIETINEAFNAMDVGPAFMHQKFVVSGSQNAMVVPMQNIMGGFGAEGGCGCTFSALPTPHNTVLPLLMAVAALGGMFVLRRNSAKKH